MAHLERSLTSALGADQPGEWWEAFEEHVDTCLVRAALPSRDEVVAVVETGQPGHMVGQLRGLAAGLPVFWLSRPVAYPSRTVDGVHITAYHDPHDGMVAIEIGTDDAEPARKIPGTGHVTIDVRLNGVPLYRPARQQPESGDGSGDPPVPCRTEGYDGDPDTGERGDGYCSDCADRRDAGAVTS
jgi:hypothetical protein